MKTILKPSPRAMLNEIDDLKKELHELQQHVSQLTEAAREVCRTKDRSNRDHLGRLLPHDDAVRNLADLINYPGWWSL